MEGRPSTVDSSRPLAHHRHHLKTTALKKGPFSSYSQLPCFPENQAKYWPQRDADRHQRLMSVARNFAVKSMGAGPKS